MTRRQYATIRVSLRSRGVGACKAEDVGDFFIVKWDLLVNGFMEDLCRAKTTRTVFVRSSTPNDRNRGSKCRLRSFASDEGLPIMLERLNTDHITGDCRAQARIKHSRKRWVNAALQCA